MLGMFDIKLGIFVALGVRGSGMIENCSFNLGEFYVKMGKTNRNLQNYKERIHIMEGRLIAFVIWVIIGVLFIVKIGRASCRERV